MSGIATPTRTPPARAALPRWWWPVLKTALVVSIIVAVGWQFVHALRQPQLWEYPLRPELKWLALTALLYLVGLSSSSVFWYWLLRALDQRPRVLSVLRAYYVGQLGRYVPGKVVGLAWRAALLSSPNVALGPAVLSVIYESLTTIASGILFGFALFAWQGSDRAGLDWRILVPIGLVCLLLLPGVFNRLANWVAKPFRSEEALPLPPVRGTTLLGGLAITACGWLVQGGTLWAMVEAVVPGAWPLSAEVWARCTAYVAVSYAAGFLVLPAPGGLGVRDFLIQQFLFADLSAALPPEQAAGVSVVAALLLRIIWIAMDVAVAVACYWLPGKASPNKAAA